jgi:hypothetical protein
MVCKECAALVRTIRTAVVLDQEILTGCNENGETPQPPSVSRAVLEGAQRRWYMEV